MADAAVHNHILRRLDQTAREEGVRILYAAESGSRAWGFASPDSDYDVRFIYAHPEDWYLRLVPGRDVIERPLDPELVDLAGWDVRKTLQLMLKSNPALYEWLCSPIVYVDDGKFQPALKSLYERHASPRTLGLHYASIAGATAARHLDRRDEVNLKRYFYVLRPILSLQWIVENGGTPPMHMDALLAGSNVPANVADAITRLIALKQETPELGSGPRLPIIDSWIEERQKTLAAAASKLSVKDQSSTASEAERLFRMTIRREL
ncbi:MAG: nucleotidyltransferase domain-containing protein [Hyphomicrobiaceae bacterium]